MKIVFTDIDGVLNNSSTKGIMYDRYEPYLIDKLNSITDQTDAVIVLSSTWRNCPDLIWLFDKLKNEMKITGTIIGMTPRLFGSHMGSYIERGEEIQAWLDLYKTSKIESFVIIDDEPPACFKGLEDRLVTTEMALGLTDKNVEDAIKILNKEIL